MHRIEVKQYLAQKGAWAAPIALGALFVCFAAMLFAATTTLSAFAPLLIPFSWVIVALAAAQSKRTHFTKGWIIAVAMSGRPISGFYRLQLLTQTLVYFVSMGLLIPFVHLALAWPLSWSPIHAVVLLVTLPGLLGLGELLKSLLPADTQGALLGILLLPLYCPVLLFAAMALQALQLGQAPWPFMALLASFSLSVIALQPVALKYTVRFGL